MSGRSPGKERILHSKLHIPGLLAINSAALAKRWQCQTHSTPSLEVSVLHQRTTAAGNGVRSLRQTRHPLKLQHEAQRYDHIVHIDAFGRLRRLSGNVPPSITFAEFARQATFHKLANIAERAQCRDGRDFQRSRQLARPIRAGQLDTPDALNQRHTLYICRAHVASSSR